jgi:ubiquinone/menaquinone biosynthesis C-methylase UbiE
MFAHRCPPWIGYLLISPLRRLIQDPHKLLAPHVTAGMTVVEPGPGMGFFTLELARLAGPSGRVIAIDIEPKMLAKLEQRARKAGVAENIVLRQPKGESLNVDDLANTVDFVPAIAVVHELPNRALFFQEMYGALRGGGKLLLLEPPGHVKRPLWEKTLASAYDAGFQRDSDPKARRFHAALLRKP